MIKRYLKLAFVAGALALTGFILPECFAEAPDCTCKGDPGVIWSGNQPIGLDGIARLAAPVLWFSPDEPLLKREDIPAIPMANPCDEPSSRPVVYYQLSELVYEGGHQVTTPPEDDPAFFAKVDQMTLRYFFYYPEDVGLASHEHDLEVVEMALKLEKSMDCYQVRVSEVTGLAHGSRWYSNKLSVEADTKFPISIFVEEGKHGSCPDRNADGIFTRGYDINHTVNDAWGVRDVLGSGILLSSNYNSEMSKPRRDDTRLLPPEIELPCVSKNNSSTAGRSEGLGRYELRRGNLVPRCGGRSENVEGFIAFMDEHDFGLERDPEQHSSELGKETLSSLRSPGSFVSFSLRSETDLGVSMVFKGLDLTQGWIVPKINASGTAASIGAMYTPSASRFFDWYLAAGPRRQYRALDIKTTVDTEEGQREIVVKRNPRWDMYWETGVKIRARLPGKIRAFSLGYHFAGFRLGVQALGFGRLDDIRLVWEIGAGAW